MTQSLTQKQALQHIAKQFADFLAGKHGNPQALDHDDLDLLHALKEGAGEHLDVMLAQSVFRKQPWLGRIPAEESPDVDMTTSQIAADVARLEDIRKQDPTLLHGSIDSLHDSWQKLDLLLEPYAKTFTDMVRRSKSFTPQGRQ